MDKKQYHLSINGENCGPFSLPEIVTQLKGGEIKATDFIYNETLGDWQLLMENDDVLSALKTQPKPNATPKVTSDVVREVPHSLSKSKKEKTTSVADFASLESNPLLTDWFVLKGENKFGPFEYTKVIKMLQEKVVFEFDFVWQHGMESWKRIAEVKAFSPEYIKKMQESLMPEIREIFFRRRHPRVPFTGSVIVHDNKKVWKGQSVELSEGGAGLVMENAMVVPGQILYVHFKSQDNLPPFNAICEVVSKKFVEGVSGKDSPICYGIRFTNLAVNTQKFLQQYTKTLGAKSAA